MLCIANAAEHAIGFIFGMAFDVALGCEFFLAFDFDGKVNVRAAAGICDRFNRAKIVFTTTAGHEPSKPLEVGVAFLTTAALGVEIDCVAVDLPDLDERVANRVAFRVENSTAEVGDFSDCRSD